MLDYKLANITKSRYNMIEKIILGLDEEGNKYSDRLNQELNKKQDLKEIISLIKTVAGKSLLLYELCLIIFADNKVDPKELLAIDEVMALIEIEGRLKEKQ